LGLGREWVETGQPALDADMAWHGFRQKFGHNGFQYLEASFQGLDLGF
jgi:hypothetical protein